ncbi:efflux RND transporter periplasmic adaptor subunit [Echinicola strongylocentroti]|uniref:Efflux RND transporter periplasmic adaptor subunit n=1 Tax=Echinicola strongylocentroti TaxID=1795355 RepID=A0A2Z4IQV4_9BACT|nr:efflux RND transporter periplasmic adaptor subunit [Echinicola strongylocentroti]AWW33110.1 efflux RND transporter periplasmic adaptor subunit [Echinicola strongylocentroti]
MRTSILMLMGLCALLLHTSCTSHGEEKEEEVYKLQVTSPVRMDTTITEDYVCQIHSINHIEVRAQERGYLDKIYVDEGQFVKKGQLLFKIMPKLYEAELQSAKAEVSFAAIEYQNTKSLADRDVVAPNELAMAKAKLDKANAELALAQTHLDFTEIRAPFNGIIDRFHVRVGSLIDEGELLTNLSDNSKMWVYYNVPEAEYLDYMTSLKKDSAATMVNLLMANNKVFGHSGKVETIEADFNHETGNIPFRATFPNPNGLLRHGETGNIQMAVPFKNAMIIPQKTTFEVLDKRYVYVLDDENQLHSREITVAAEMPHLYVVQDGLEENDKVLLEGLRLVRENDVIHPDIVSPEAAISSLGLYAE